MSDAQSRREFLKRSTRAGTALALGARGAALPPVHAWAGGGQPEPIPVRPELEPLVRLIYETPRERVIGRVLEEVRRGLPYRRLLAANYLAAIRYDLSGAHGVFVTQAVDQVGRALGREERFLPLFYHLGVLRTQERAPYLRRVPDAELPPPARAAAAFRGAMEADDAEAASRALLALSRHEGPRRTFARLWPYAAERNLTSGGHTAVGAANAYRTLEAIGWEHAEPTFQFLAHDMRSRGQGNNPVCVENAARARAVGELPGGWNGRRGDRAAVMDLLARFREGAPAAACGAAAAALRKGAVRAGDLWDAVFLATAELMVRFRYCGPAGLAGHAVTCTNALHFAFRTVSAPETRLLLLLEAIHWSADFLTRERDRDALRGITLPEVEPDEIPGTDAAAVEAIFALLPPRRFFDFSLSPRADQDRAMRMTLALARRSPDAALFLRTARRQLCLRSTREVHDFKFPIALFEHYRHASAAWKPHLLAASAHYLHGPRMEPTPWVEEAREGLSRE